jgi:ketosteroid isomerase-like protein
MKAVRYTCVLALFGFFTACQTSGEPDPAADPGADAEVAQQLAERLDAYEQALLTGQAAPVKSFWTDDARVLVPGADLIGSELASFIDDFFAAGGVIRSVEFRTADIFVHGDAAYELGQYEETGQVGIQEPEHVSANYFLRWERQPDGSWKIDRFVSGPTAAPEEPS